MPEEERQRFCLSDEDAHKLANDALLIEAHYGRQMDIEWAKDGESGELFIVQARPETVKSRAAAVIERYQIISKGELLAEGRAVGQKMASVWRGWLPALMTWSACRPAMC